MLGFPVTISNAAVTTSSIIMLTYNDSLNSPLNAMPLSVETISAGSFTVVGMPGRQFMWVVINAP